MELDNLEAFLVFAEELHFGRAAQRLNVSQSSLSRQIQGLEHDLRVRLFERTTRKAKLTVAGTVLADGAPEMIARFAALISRVQSA
jgi:DNA-binding transcriptional LysR family regulator